MIEYYKGAYSLNLIFRAHGSATYKAILPGLVAVVVYLLLTVPYSPDPQIDPGTNQQARQIDALRHPYAAGVLVSAVSFIIIFRANNSYQRYWEACGAVHHFMSKWLDAVVHTGVYHYQCDHLRPAKPPSYFDNDDLNRYHLTRDRERKEGMEVELAPGKDGMRYRYQARGRSEGDVGMGRIAEEESGTGGGAARAESAAAAAGGHAASAKSKKSKMAREEEALQMRRRRVAKSIEFVDGRPPGTSRAKYKRSLSDGEMHEPHQTRKTVSDMSGLHVLPEKIRWNGAGRLSGVPGGGGGESSRQNASLSSGDIDLMAGSERNWIPASFTDGSASADGGIMGSGDPTATLSATAHLLGRGRLDGGWGLLFRDDKLRGPTSTHYAMDSTDPFIDKRDPLANGFSSTRGGRTPDLFLQELAHLTSLCVAVAFCTLRNDVEGAASPLSTYYPGEDWPEVDPDHIPRQHGSWLPTWMLTKNIKYFLGMDKTQTARTKFNRTRPMPVIGGVSENEIAFLQKARGPSAKVTLAWGWLSEFIIREHLAGSLGAVGPPIISRIFQFLSDGMIFYNHARKIMFIPFPFPHAQLTAIFTVTLLFAVPLLMVEFTGFNWLGSLLTFLTVTCLTGLHEVAKELENPFRNVPNDIPLCTLLAYFNESLITMFAGYHPDHYWDANKFRRMYAAQLSMVKEEPSERELSGAAAGNSSLAANAAKNKSASATESSSSSAAPQSASPPEPPQDMSLSELQEMIRKQSEEIERLKKKMEESDNKEKAIYSDEGKSIKR